MSQLDSQEILHELHNVSMVSSFDEPIVNSFNEWDALEEVIVGVIDGAAIPAWHVTLEATMPTQSEGLFRKYGGKPFPQEQVDAARQELETFVHILEAEGVTVRRPDVVDFTRPYKTPHWESPGGLYAAMPRDTILVVGDDLIECPMAWRSRYFEIEAYRPLLTEYFRKGARWTAAPKPLLTDHFYNYDYEIDNLDENNPTSSITELEPTFDAADFIRCGRDIFCQKSQVTNSLGIEWLRRHLGSEYTVHELDVDDPGAMHIDATFMPLAPGKVLVNPKKIGRIPEFVARTWDILYAPPPSIPDTVPLYMSSKWISMNFLMLDHERIVVEEHEETLIQNLKDWGFKPIVCGFRNFNAFGGSFHCATLDVRRTGTLESYF